MSLFSSVIGNIGLPEYLAGGYGDLINGGLIALVSNIVKLIMILGGVWSFFNLLTAGFSYITSGDKPDEITKANQKMTMSLLGLVILVGSIIITGIISLILYSDPRAILNPQIYGPK